MESGKNTALPDVVFLSFCQRAQYNKRISTWNILGLGKTLYPFILPYRLNGWYASFAVNNHVIVKEKVIKIELLNQDDVQVGYLDLNIITSNTTVDTSIDPRSASTDVSTDQQEEHYTQMARRLCVFLLLIAIL